MTPPLPRRASWRGHGEGLRPTALTRSLEAQRCALIPLIAVRKYLGADNDLKNQNGGHVLSHSLRVTARPLALKKLRSASIAEMPIVSQRT